MPTGVACQQGTLTLPDTWFCPPLWDLLVFQWLRPDSSNLSCLYSTFHLEYSLVLSRFCLVSSPHIFLERIRFWLKSVSTMKFLDEKGEEVNPPVLFVGTHRDLLENEITVVRLTETMNKKDVIL